MKLEGGRRDAATGTRERRGKRQKEQGRKERKKGGVVAFVALGSNLGDSRRILQRALQQLESLSCRPLRVSSFMETDPVDCPPGSPRFLNAVAALEPLPGVTPESLFDKLQDIERAFGPRPRAVPNEPRRLDLDLVAFGEERRTGSKLTLPHPRAHLRRFVLQPLAEIAPDLVLPGGKKTVTDLLKARKAGEARDNKAQLKMRR